MKHKEINNFLSRFTDEESKVCMAMNAFASKQPDDFRFYLSFEASKAMGHFAHPDYRIREFTYRCDGVPYTSINGGWSSITSHRLHRPVSMNQGGINIDKDGNITIHRQIHLKVESYGHIDDVETVEREWKPWGGYGKKVSSSPKCKAASMTSKEAADLIVKHMWDMPITKMGRHSSYKGIREEPCFVQSLTEDAVTLSMTRASLVDSYLSTSIRTELPLPYGGIDAVKRDKDGFTQEDRVQMSGCDIMQMPSSMGPRSQIYRTGKKFDTKLIASVAGPDYDTIPIEAFRENIQVSQNADPSVRFMFECDNLWPFSDVDVDVAIVVRNQCYLVTKASLHKVIKQWVGHFKQSGYARLARLKPNSRKERINAKTVKWNVYLTEDELADISYSKFELPAEYGQILAEKGGDIIDFYSTKAPDDFYTHWQVRLYWEEDPDGMESIFDL